MSQHNKDKFWTNYKEFFSIPGHLVLVHIVAAAIQGTEPPAKDATVAVEGGRTLS